MYIVSTMTVFDNDHQLWETYVGRDLPDKPLDYSVWGDTQADSKINAIKLANTLNTNR